MIFLWLSILSSTSIYFLFKIRGRLNADLHGIIVINYLVATILGLLNHNINAITTIISNARWLPIATLIGLLFAAMFFLIGSSTHKAGMVVTTLATRMSMVFPIFFSMFLFDEEVTAIRLLKIFITIVAVIMAIYRKPDKKIVKPVAAILPFILFIGSGSVDTLVKTAQHVFVPDDEISLFSSVLFATSFIGALLGFFIKKPQKSAISINTILLGITLGVANWGSLFFVMKALNHSGIDSSLVFGINNLAIVSFSLILGFAIFKEKLSRLNWVGVAASILCIILLIEY
jgi:drug/metabolite transporter (DMT)-like permease